MALPIDSQSSELSKDNILDLLKDEEKTEEKEEKLEIKEDEEEEEEKEEKEEKEDDDEGEEEKEDLKLDDDELDESKFDLIAPVSKKEILAAFPELFKKFPQLEVSYYRDRQFTEILPTIDDAKEAVEKSQTLDRYETQLLKGNTSEILQTVKENDPEAFNRIADNYMAVLHKVDEKAYYNVVGNLIKFTIMNMANEAKEKNDEKLLEHATALNEFVFSTKKWTGPTRLSKEETKVEESVSEERKAFLQERFMTVQSDLQTKADNAITSTIDANIDQNKQMTPFVKKHATKDAFDKLEELLGQDKQLKVVLNRLWKSSQEDKYSSSSLDKIKSAYLSRAKTLLPSVIKLARQEALKGIGKKTSSDDEKDKRGHITVGRTSSSEKPRGKNEIPKGMSNKDFIMAD